MGPTTRGRETVRCVVAGLGSLCSNTMQARLLGSRLKFGIHRLRNFATAESTSTRASYDELYGNYVESQRKFYGLDHYGPYKTPIFDHPNFMGSAESGFRQPRTTPRVPRLQPSSTPEGGEVLGQKPKWTSILFNRNTIILLAVLGSAVAEKWKSPAALPPPVPDSAPPCRYGAACRSKSPEHFQKYSHPDTT